MLLSLSLSLPPYPLCVSVSVSVSQSYWGRGETSREAVTFHHEGDGGHEEEGEDGVDSEQVRARHFVLLHHDLGVGATRGKEEVGKHLPSHKHTCCQRH